MINSIDFPLQQFRQFDDCLMKSAPEGYTPWYFPVESGDKNPDFKTIRLRTGGSVSFKHPKARLNRQECEERIRQGGNIGLCAMTDDPLQIIDCDDDDIFAQLKPTLTTRGRSRVGGHGWYFVEVSK